MPDDGLHGTWASQGGSKAWTGLTSLSWTPASTSVCTTKHPQPAGRAPGSGQTPGLCVMAHTDRDIRRSVLRTEPAPGHTLPGRLVTHRRPHPRLEFIFLGCGVVSDAARVPVRGQAQGRAPVTPAQPKDSPHVLPRPQSRHAAFWSGREFLRPAEKGSPPGVTRW